MTDCLLGVKHNLSLTHKPNWSKGGGKYFWINLHVCTLNRGRSILRHCLTTWIWIMLRGRRAGVIVGFTTYCAISAFINKAVSSNPALGEVCSIQHYVIKYVKALQQVSSTNKTPPWYSSNIVESDVKHKSHNLTPRLKLDDINFSVPSYMLMFK